MWLPRHSDPIWLTLPSLAFWCASLRYPGRRFAISPSVLSLPWSITLMGCCGNRSAGRLRVLTDQIKRPDSISPLISIPLLLYDVAGRGFCALSFLRGPLEPVAKTASNTFWSSFSLLFRVMVVTIYTPGVLNLLLRTCFFDLIRRSSDSEFSLK
jgi:hypothetical protein